MAPDLDADHARGQLGQQRRLIAVAGADLQHLPAVAPGRAIINIGMAAGWCHRTRIPPPGQR
jgi:hypothetical protein